MDASTATPSSQPAPSNENPGPSRTGAAAADDKPPQQRRADAPANVLQLSEAGPILLLERSTDVRQWVDEDWLRARIRDAVLHVDHSIERISFYLVDDDQMSRLHGRICGESGTTDVITMPLTDPGKPIDAEIVLCVDEAFRRAAEYGHCAEQELLLYALHGVLHCAGYDDLDDAGYRAMHTEEDRILEAIGVGRTFNRTA